MDVSNTKRNPLSWAGEITGRSHFAIAQGIYPASLYDSYLQLLRLQWLASAGGSGVLIETSVRTMPIGRRGGWRRKRSEDGAVAVMAAFLIILMIGMFGMALDLSRNYNRKVELQSAADAAALAAAFNLNGTPEGIDKALDDARQAAEANNIVYGRTAISWSSDALTFGTSAASGADGWMDATQAKASAASMFFARVDTSALASGHGTVRNFLIPIMSSALAETKVAAVAVAGRQSLNVLPLAICANADKAADFLPSGELVEHGFRRGISYDLMNLNPGGRLAENFLVNPVAPPGMVGKSMLDSPAAVAPFICTGKMAIPTLRSGEITVERGFPIKTLYPYLNARFGLYTPPCDSSTAPADTVVKSFDLTSTTAWMKDKPEALAAKPLAAPDPLLTVAEKPAGATKTAYGPLWSYAKAAKYASYLAKGGKEPPEGYDTFKPTDWGTLYDPGKPEAQSYPTTTPYLANGGIVPYKAYRNTRVLHIPLLRCPVGTQAKTTASVVGIAKFFMTVPASSSAVHAEFAGMDTEPALGGNVRLYR
jgi:Flp pilus assembly protein TadG